MKVVVIASGSKGNCTLVNANGKYFLIDVGINITQLKNALSDIGLSLNDISFVLITHTHSDHIKGLESFLKKTNASLYSSSGILDDLKKIISSKNIHIIDKIINVEGIGIEAIPLSHDVECYGYIIDEDNKKMVYITDTGYLNRKIYPQIKDMDLYIIESNHDEKMLMDGPYPYILKQRIISDKGHLSNTTTGKVLCKVVGKSTKKVVLAHLSEHNNTKELAYSQVSDELEKIGFDTKKIIISDQYISSPVIEV